MGGGSFLESIITILVELGIPWEPWMANLIVFGGAMILFPFFLRNIRISQARNKLKRSNVIYGEERRAMEVEAMEKVKDIPTALLGLADQAIVMKRYELAEEFISHVPRTKKYKRELVAIYKKINPDSHRNLPSELLAIEQLKANGLNDLAEKRWQDAKRRWPNAVELGEEFLLGKVES